MSEKKLQGMPICFEDAENRKSLIPGGSQKILCKLTLCLCKLYIGKLAYCNALSWLGKSLLVVSLSLSRDIPIAQRGWETFCDVLELELKAFKLMDNLITEYFQSTSKERKITFEEECQSVRKDDSSSTVTHVCPHHQLQVLLCFVGHLHDNRSGQLVTKIFFIP